MLNEGCGNCKWTLEVIHPDTARPHLFMCRRYPPQASAVLVNGVVQNVNIFPTCGPDDWCGEWKEGKPEIMHLPEDTK